MVFRVGAVCRERRHCLKAQCQNDDPRDRRTIPSSLTVTQDNYPRPQFKIKSPKSPSLIFKCTDVLGFIIQATLSLQTKSDYGNLCILLISSRPGTLFTFREHLIIAPHLTSKIWLPQSIRKLPPIWGFFVAIFLSHFEQRSLKISPSDGWFGPVSCI